MNDPRYLSQILTDLIKSVQKWSFSSCQIFKEADYVQRNAWEQAERAHHNASVKKNQSSEDQAEVNRNKNNAEESASTAESAVTSSLELMDEVSYALNSAKNTLSHWQSELKKALEWLRRAREWVEKALYALHQAMDEFNSAKEALERAIHNLERCRNSYRTDSRGNRIRSDCRSEARQVQYSEIQFNEARQKALDAEEEVQRARDELAQAEAWVDRCEKAVTYAEEAVLIANKALDHATQAQNFAERSKEDAEVVLRYIENAQDKASQERKITDSMMAYVSKVQNFSYNAEFHFKQSVTAYESAQRLAIGGCKELEFRIDQLFEFDLPPHKEIR